MIEHRRHPHLPTIHFAEAAKILPCDANGGMAFRTLAGFIDDQGTVVMTTEEAIGRRDDLVADPLIFPVGCWDEMLDLLAIGHIRNQPTDHVHIAMVAQLQ